MAKGGPGGAGSGPATSSQNARATISLDTDSFATPLAEQINAAQLAFRSASQPVKGAAKRIQQALDDLEDLRTFSEEIETHLRHGSFASLPRIGRRTSSQPTRLHRLEVGPFAAAFLVSEDGQSVIGLSFARLPHDFNADVSGLLARYLPEDDGD